MKSCLCVLLGLHAILLGYSAWMNSPGYDEVAHISAGVSHWRYGRFDLYRVNPPLVRSVAAIPILLVDHEEDWSSYTTNPVVRDEFTVGNDFANVNGRRVFRLYAFARMACIPFSLLGMWISTVWAKQLYGEPASIAVATLWAFSPSMLANGYMATPDCAAAATGVAALYLFSIWLNSAEWTDCLLAALAFGVALITKHTWVVLFALYPMIWLVYRVKKTEETKTPPMKQLAVMLAIPILVVNSFYGFEGTFKRLGEYQFLSKTLGGDREGSLWEPDNRFKNTLLGDIPVPLPRNYVSGIDLQKQRFRSWNSVLPSRRVEARRMVSLLPLRDADQNPDRNVDLARNGHHLDDQ